LVFVDSDVLVPADTFTIFTKHFADPDGPAAVTCTFSLHCPAKSWYSRHKNLFQSYILNSAEWSGTLNTSLTAIRRDVFVRHGGFDRRWPASEDNALGAAMAASGDRIVLDRSLAVEHLKEFTLRSLLRDDWIKAYWTARQLWSRGTAVVSDVRAGIGHHHSPSVMATVVTAQLVLLGLLAAVASAGPVSGLFLGLALAAHVAANWAYYKLVVGHEGLGFAIPSALLHWIEMVVSGAAVGLALFDELRAHWSPARERT
jgi:hypothetical protein